MEGTWSRALVDPKELHDFWLNGISPPQQRRSAPKYIPAVFSVPIESGSRCEDVEYSSIESEDETITCFNLKKREKKRCKKPIPLKKRSAVLEKVPNFRATDHNSDSHSITTAIKVIHNSKNKSTKSESMSVLKNDTNDRIITEKATRYASNPEMSTPCFSENEMLSENSNELTISLAEKQFKYKRFLASRYSTDLEVENQLMKNLLIHRKISLSDKGKKHKMKKTGASDECQDIVEKDPYNNLTNNIPDEKCTHNLPDIKGNRFDMEGDDTIAFKTIEPTHRDSYEGKLEEISKYASFNDDGQPIEYNLAFGRAEENNREVVAARECSVQTNISTQSLDNISTISGDSQEYQNVDHFTVINDNNDLASYKNYQNITEEELQTDTSSILSVSSKFSEIEDQRKLFMEESDNNDKYATFDDTGEIVNKISDMKMCCDNFSTNWKEQSNKIGDLDSTSKDISKDWPRNRTNKTSCENCKVSSYQINSYENTSQVYHFKDKNKKNSLKQQDSIDSAMSINSSEIPDLEVLPDQNYLEEFNFSGINPRKTTSNEFENHVSFPHN